MSLEVNERQEVGQFFKTGALFLLPLTVIFAFPLAALLSSGELISPSEVLRRQEKSSGPVLYGPVYSNTSRYYKLRGVLDRRPEVLILGTSRTMQFRDYFFKRPDKFYNAGGGVGRIKHFRAFLSHIPQGSEPRELIIGLDQYFFNPNFEIMADDDIQYRLSPESMSPLAVFQFAWLKTFRDWKAGKFTWSRLLAAHRASIGMNAIMNLRGFRNDGSYDYGLSALSPLDPRSEDFEFRDTFARIADGRDAYEHADDVSPATLEELRLFLADCAERGIHVVGFMPPYAHAAYRKMVESGNYHYLDKLMPALSPVFNQYGFKIFDYSDVSGLGMTDHEFFDGFHGNEKVSKFMIQKMVVGDKALAAYVQ